MFVLTAQQRQHRGIAARHRRHRLTRRFLQDGHYLCRKLGRGQRKKVRACSVGVGGGCGVGGGGGARHHVGHVRVRWHHVGVRQKLALHVLEGAKHVVVGGHAQCLSERLGEDELFVVQHQHGREYENNGGHEHAQDKGPDFTTHGGYE